MDPPWCSIQHHSISLPIIMAGSEIPWRPWSTMHGMFAGFSKLFCPNIVLNTMIANNNMNRVELQTHIDYNIEHCNMYDKNESK